MTKPTFLSRTALLTAALTLAPLLVQAHPGHDGHDVGFSAGLVHPLNGVDHLLAMVAVGLWAVQLGGRALWAVPGAFIAAMSLGGILGMNGINLAFAEHGIMASIFVLGALIAMAARLSMAQSSVLVALFALFHGFAHAAEAPVAANGTQYVIGFAIATAVLHAFGVLSGSALKAAAQSRYMRIAGMAVIAGGVFLSLN